MCTRDSCNALEPDFLGKLIGVHSMPSPLCPVGKNIHSVLNTSYAKIHEDLRSSLQSISMREIMDNYKNS
ncbi:MAG: hypothetical protein K2I21_05390, partial [Acetatifactor sp.]|nr:hypothetical protein [Acetatifactor sp.]